MPRPLSQQVVVVTGASSGIGRAAARYLAGRGARVVLTARRAGVLDELARQIEGAGGRALAVPGDVTREEDLRTVARAAVERFGRIDTWVNDAGVMIQGRVQDVEPEELRRLLDVNLVGTIHGTRCALEVMLPQGEGVIVQVASVAAKRPIPYLSAYSASKAAIAAFTEALRAELRGTGVLLSVLYPPTVDTPVYEHARARLGVQPKPFAPMARPVEAARAIARLAETGRRERSFFWARPIALLDALAPELAGRLVFAVQRGNWADRPPNPDDALDAPAETVLATAARGWSEPGWRGLTWHELVRVLAPSASDTTTIHGKRREGSSEMHESTHERERQNERSMVAGALKGALAGAIGVWALTRVTWAMWDREDPDDLRREEAARPGGLDPAHVLVHRAAERMGRRLDPRQPHPAGNAMHYALGILPAALYGALRSRSDKVKPGFGLLLGLGLFLLQDELLNPLLGTSGRPREYPWQAHARGLVGHAVYGAALDATLAAIDPPRAVHREPAAADLAPLAGSERSVTTGMAGIGEGGVPASG